MVMLDKVRDLCTSTRSFAWVLCLGCAVGLPATAWAEDAPVAAMAEGQAAPRASVASQRLAPEVRAHHAPISISAAGAQISIEATFHNIHLLREAVVIYRLPDGTLRSTPFRRSGSANLSYVAVIPPEDVIAPGLDYTIEVERVDGVRASAFASRTRMHHVQVRENHTDAFERVLLKRREGRRSTAAVMWEYVDFGEGSSSTDGTDGGRSPSPTPTPSASYWRAELSYSYQLLQLLTEFSLRIGYLRGDVVSERARNEATAEDSCRLNSAAVTPPPNTNQVQESPCKAKLIYAATGVRLRLLDRLHVEGGPLACLTQSSFCMGGSGAVTVGDPRSSTVSLGFETFVPLSDQSFGGRVFGRIGFPATDWLSLASMIELTNMPQADDYGIQLIGDATVKLFSGVAVGLRGGYASRAGSSGGSMSGRVAVSF